MRPGPRARFCDVGSIILADALVEQLALMVGQAALALPIGLCVPCVYAEVAVLLRVYCTDVELVEADDTLQARKKIANLLCLGRICREVRGGDG